MPKPTAATFPALARLARSRSSEGRAQIRDLLGGEPGELAHRFRMAELGAAGPDCEEGLDRLLEAAGHVRATLDRLERVAGRAGLSVRGA